MMRTRRGATTDGWMEIETAKMLAFLINKAGRWEEEFDEGMIDGGKNGP